METIELLGHPALRMKAKEVAVAEIKSDNIQKVIQNMIRIMREEEGVGIAAPQIGIPLRIFCVECRNDDRYEDVPSIKLYTVINPVLTILDSSTEWMYEGCLSVPELRGPVQRAKKAKVSGLNELGEIIEIEAQGFHARILQHETDHLNGTIFIDHVKDLKDLVYQEYLT